MTASPIPSVENRRAHPRRQPAADTVCRLDAAPDLGLVWNISAGGVSMLLRDELARGATVRGQLESAGSALPVTMRVAHVARLQTGDYIIGGQFDRLLTADEMRPFVGG